MKTSFLRRYDYTSDKINLIYKQNKETSFYPLKLNNTQLVPDQVLHYARWLEYWINNTC